MGANAREEENAYREIASLYWSSKEVRERCTIDFKTVSMYSFHSLWRFGMVTVLPLWAYQLSKCPSAV